MMRYPPELTRQFQAWLQSQMAPEKTAFTPAQFRFRNGEMSEANYYAMMKAGRGPATLRVGNVVLISAQEEQDWLRRMTHPTGAEAVRQKAERAQAQQRSLRAAKASAASEKHISKQRQRAIAARAATE
jgi:hypothetical protein